jgi:hypothetical protein
MHARGEKIKKELECQQGRYTTIFLPQTNPKGSEGF